MFVLPYLPYAKDALEPYISENTLSFHYGKHHAGYVAKLNTALENHEDLLAMSIDSLLINYQKTPETLHQAILNNGGQHYNHSLYWESMTGEKGMEPSAELMEAINNSFGSFDDFKEVFVKAGSTQFGSGWAWLSIDDSGKLAVDKTSNADTPLLHGKQPIMVMDVWEHAYYLDYQNKRPEYIEKFWKVVNWSGVSQKYQEFTS